MNNPSCTNSKEQNTTLCAIMSHCTPVDAEMRHKTLLCQIYVRLPQQWILRLQYAGHLLGWYLFTEVKKVKCSCYRSGVAQRVGRGIALLFHDCGTRRGWVVSSTPWLQFTPGKDPVPIVQEARWVPGPVWMGRKSHPNQDSIPDCPAHSSVAIPTKLPSPHLLKYML